MENAAKIQNPNLGLRWVVLFVILLNIAFSYLSQYLPGGRTMQEISDQYKNLLTPAPFTFSIWGLIYFAWIIYGIAQVLPSEKGKWIYDHLARPVLFTQVMGILWVMAFRYELMNTSYVIIWLMLAGGIVAFGRIKHAMINPAYSRMLTLPFSLFLGWMSVAVILHTVIYFLYQGLRFSHGEMLSYAGLIIAGAFILAMVISMVFRDWVYPLVMAWAFYGIHASQKGFNPAIAEPALIAAAILLLWGLSYGIYRSTRLKRFLDDYRHLQSHQAGHRA